MLAGHLSVQSPHGSSEDDRRGDMTGVQLDSLAVMFTVRADSNQFAETHGAFVAVPKRRAHDDLLCPLVDEHGRTLVNVIVDARAQPEGCEHFKTECVGTIQARGVGELELHRVLWDGDEQVARPTRIDIVVRSSRKVQGRPNGHSILQIELLRGWRATPH